MYEIHVLSNAAATMGVSSAFHLSIKIKTSLGHATFDPPILGPLFFDFYQLCTFLPWFLGNNP